MSRDIQWTDADPVTGDRRFVCAEKFARQWHFKVRHKRRENWSKTYVPSRTMWEDLLEALERRVQRSEGITDDDVAAVRAILAKLPEDSSPRED